MLLILCSSYCNDHRNLVLQRSTCDVNVFPFKSNTLQLHLINYYLDVTGAVVAVTLAPLWQSSAEVYTCHPLDQLRYLE